MKNTKVCIYKNSTKSYKVYKETDENNKTWIVAYSYEAPIAILNDNTGNLFLTPYSDYSVTTQKHLRHFYENYVNQYQYPTSYGTPLVKQLKKLNVIITNNYCRGPVFVY
jgi:hypothetical protein